MATQTVAPPAPPIDNDPVIEPRDVPRRIGRRSLDDWLTLLGAALSALALIWVIYEHLLAWSGGVGFAVLWYLAFLGLYAGLTSMTQPFSIVKDRIATAIVAGAALIVV